MEHIRKYTRNLTNTQRLGIIIFVIFAIKFPFFALPVAITFLLFKKKWFSKGLNYVISIILIIVSFAFGINLIYAKQQAPVLTITQPDQDVVSVQASSYNIEGTVKPKNSTVTINELDIDVGPRGMFSYEVDLPHETQEFGIKAINKNHTSKVDEKRFMIIRLYSEEEKAEFVRKEAEKQAELEAYYQTKPGKICKAHPMWEPEDCEKVADGRVWVGMDLEMLKYERGLADDVNYSNYGDGDQVQVCWFDYTPSCFYFNNNDTIVDAYN